jgi:hypothetical protein
MLIKAIHKFWCTCWLYFVGWRLSWPAMFVWSRNTKPLQSETRTPTVWILRDSAFDWSLASCQNSSLISRRTLKSLAYLRQYVTRICASPIWFDRRNIWLFPSCGLCAFPTDSGLGTIWHSNLASPHFWIYLFFKYTFNFLVACWKWNVRVALGGHPTGFRFIPSFSHFVKIRPSTFSSCVISNCCATTNRRSSSSLPSCVSLFLELRCKVGPTSVESVPANLS